MTTPTIRTALTSDDIPPGPFSEDDLRQRWNQQADEHNQWESLDSCEQLAWAQVLAIRADRQAPATSTPSPVAPAGGLLESIARIIASDTSEGPEAFQGISKDVIHRVAEWLDVRGHYVYSVLLRKEIDT
jgi:hypothetical protein